MSSMVTLFIVLIFIAMWEHLFSHSNILYRICTEDCAQVKLVVNLSASGVNCTDGLCDHRNVIYLLITDTWEGGDKAVSSAHPPTDLAYLIKLRLLQ